MKQEIKITDFLRTGKFGNVEIHDSYDSVIEKLGKPDGNIRVVKHKRGIHYSMYEFVFSNNKLESIQNDRFDPEFPELTEFENDNFKVNTDFLKANSIKKLSEITFKLNQLHIGYDIIDYHDRKAIKTTSNVIIDFNDEFWSDKHNDFVKIDSIENYEFIGIRYFSNDE